MEQNQFNGITLTYLLEYINNLSEDGLDEEAFIFHFNHAVNNLNNRLGTLFPTITESDLNSLYPNIEYSLPLEQLTMSEIVSLYNKPIISKDVDISFPKLIRFLTISKTVPADISTTKGLIQFQGLDLKDNNFKNIYRLKIQLGLDESNVVIGDPEKMFNILKINSDKTPMEFFYKSHSNGTFEFYVKTTQSVGTIVSPLIINEAEQFNSVNFDIDTKIHTLTKAEETALGTISPIDFKKFFYVMPKFWLTSLIVPMIQRSIKIQEDEPYESIQINSSEIDNFINNFASNLLKELPNELFPKRKKFIKGKKNNTGRYFI